MFHKLKRKLVIASFLIYPDPFKTFILDTNASNIGIGAVLSQNIKRVIAYGNKMLTNFEKWYCFTLKELLLSSIY